MANPEHLKILKRGVKAWNRWMDENWRKLQSKDFVLSPDLSGADLRGKDFTSANFLFVNLSKSDLTGARLISTNLSAAKLVGAKLNKAVLTSADLTQADLGGANLRDTVFQFTLFLDTNLAQARGLDSCRHIGRSTIDHLTIQKSGRLPLNFLRGCGLPDTLIEFLPSLLNEPIQFYSAFISYSSKDQIFADRLYVDLQNKGVRCWLASEDLKIGAKTRIAIDESIRIHDKLLLVLSKYSVTSDWVEQEVETALDRERKEKRTLLFPIRLDNAVMKIDSGWPSLIKNSRNIGDFRHWRTPEAYRQAFDRLVRDLKVVE